MLTFKRPLWKAVLVALYIVAAYLFVAFDRSWSFLTAFYLGVSLALISVGVNRGDAKRREDKKRLDIDVGDVRCLHNATHSDNPAEARGTTPLLSTRQ